MLAIALTLVTIRGVAAVPVPRSVSPTVSPTAAACLAVAAAALVLLLIVKRVLVRIRRVDIFRHNSDLSLPSSVGSSQSGSTYEKSGLYVGMFGSPTVEIQNVMEKKDWSQHHHLAYRIHTDSRGRPRLEYPSVLDISRRFSEPQERKLPLYSLPPVPEPAYGHSPQNPQPRRFSLPAMHRSTTGDSHRHRRRHSSLKSAKSRRSVSFAGSSDISAQSPATTPRLAPVGAVSPLPSWNMPSPKLGRSFSRPLPPLPSFTAQPTGPPIRSLQISHPFALQQKKTIQTSPPLHATSGLSPQMRPLRLSPLSSFPAPPDNLVVPKPKPKLRIRTRRSPTVGPPGPSPLRTMTLPEASSSEGHSDLGCRLPAGLGVPEVADRPVSSATDQAPDALIGILRELIDETNDWAPDSIYMSESFRNLLQQSSLSASNLGEHSEGGGLSESDSEGSIRSAEIDPTLLGIDFFNSDMLVETGHGDVSSAVDDEDANGVGMAW
ncbi:hypothetical protein MKEN_00104200 [Mycena kentingensis (nom. inval.)]|nr:hypothetical protein MKEN_00104200 [Mycena kentingensis (nom. inval.)]